MLRSAKSRSGKVFTITLIATLALCLIVFAYYVTNAAKRQGIRQSKEGVIMSPAPAARAPEIPEGARQAKAREKIVHVGTPKDLVSVFERYPKEDVGDDMHKAWARFLPEDKAKLTNGIDKKITECQDALSIDQNDRRAKSALKVSRMLKKLIDNEFNIEFKTKQVSAEKKE